MNKFKSTSVIFLLYDLLFSDHAHAIDYRQCIKNKMKNTIDKNPCKFDKYYAGELTAQSSCSSLLTKELMATPLTIVKK